MTQNPTLNSTPLLPAGDGNASYNNRVPDPKGEAVYDFNTKQVHHPFKKIVDKKTKKKIKNREFLKFQKKMINDFLAILKKKEFTTKPQKSTFKILEKQMKSLSNKKIYTKSNHKKFLVIYHRINVVEVKGKLFSKKKRLSLKFKKNKMRDYIENCRKIFRISCCVLESENDFLSPNDKPDYNLIDNAKLIDLILYSLLEPEAMMLIIEDLDEIKCSNLGENLATIEKELKFLFEDSISHISL